MRGETVQEHSLGQRLVAETIIDQGGCFETSRPTTHGDPTFVVDDILRYCVANMPGAVPAAKEGSPGRRGTAATIFVEKIAGALAAEGAPLADVKALAERVVAASR